MSYYEYIEGRLVKQEGESGFNDDEEWENWHEFIRLTAFFNNNVSGLCITVYENKSFIGQWIAEIEIGRVGYEVSIKGPDNFLGFMKEYKCLFVDGGSVCQ